MTPLSRQISKLFSYLCAYWLLNPSLYIITSYSLRQWQAVILLYAITLESQQSIIYLMISLQSAINKYLLVDYVSKKLLLFICCIAACV